MFSNHGSISRRLAVAMLPLFVGACGAQSASKQSVSPLTAQAASIAHSYEQPLQADLAAEFERFLSIPNVAADPAGLQQNAAFLQDQLRSLGLETKLLTAPGLEHVPPVVWGELKTPGATTTIVFYAHYDGQPVTPSEWIGGQPFKPYEKAVEGEQRIYARSAGDDKAAIFAQLIALRAIRAAHLPLRANLRFVWEGEEEAGSAHLEQILMANRALIGGAIWLVCDGPVDQTRMQSLAFGARGDTHVQITVYGPAHPLHSGHYGTGRPTRRWSWRSYWPA